MNDLELAVRCLEIEQEVASREARIREIVVACAFSDSDDDAPLDAEAAGLRSEIEELRAEQANCSAWMKSPPDLAYVIAAEAKKAAKKGAA